MKEAGKEVAIVAQKKVRKEEGTWSWSERKHRWLINKERKCQTRKGRTKRRPEANKESKGGRETNRKWKDTQIYFGMFQGQGRCGMSMGLHKGI